MPLAWMLLGLADGLLQSQRADLKPLDRTKEVSEPYQIEAWFGFTFPGRGDEYGAQKYHWYHFSGQASH